MEHKKGDDYNNRDWCIRYSNERAIRGTEGRVETKLQHCWERPEYWEESWRLAVTQTPVKDHQR